VACYSSQTSVGTEVKIQIYGEYERVRLTRLKRNLITPGGPIWSSDKMATAKSNGSDMVNCQERGGWAYSARAVSVRIAGTEGGKADIRC
jgi:hypothetical protein